MLLLLAAAWVVFNWPSVARMYSVITLFDEDKIVHNFMHMDHSFSSVEIGWSILLILAEGKGFGIAKFILYPLFYPLLYIISF